MRGLNSPLVSKVAENPLTLIRPLCRLLTRTLSTRLRTILFWPTLTTFTRGPVFVFFCLAAVASGPAGIPAAVPASTTTKTSGAKTSALFQFHFKSATRPARQRHDFGKRAASLSLSRTGRVRSN